MSTTTVASAGEPSQTQDLFVVTVIAPEGEDGSKTTILTVPDMDAIATAIPDFVDFPTAVRANKRDLDTRQVEKANSNLDSSYWKPSNGTVVTAFVPVTGSSSVVGADVMTLIVSVVCTAVLLNAALGRQFL